MDNPLKYFAELRDPRVERCRKLERHCRVWRGQVGVVEDVFDASIRYFIARYLQPGLCRTGPGGDRKGLHRLGFVDRQADCGRSRGHRRQRLVRHTRDQQEDAGAMEREICYYITSLRPDAGRLNSVIRQHWASRTNCIVCWMWVLAKPWTVNAPATRRRTSRSSTASPPTCSNRTKLPSAESRENASKLPGTTHTCLTAGNLICVGPVYLAVQ